MAQASIISRPSQLPSAEINLGGTSTTEKVFLNTAGTPLICPFPGLEELAGANGKKCSMFKVVAFGRATTGTTANVTIQLQFGTSATTASNLDMESGAAVSFVSASGSWSIEGTYIIDYTSGKIGGYSNCTHTAATATTLTAAAAIDNIVTSSSTAALSFTTTSVQGMVLTCTFSSGNAANVAYVDGFQIEMIG